MRLKFLLLTFLFLICSQGFTHFAEAEGTGDGAGGGSTIQLAGSSCGFLLDLLESFQSEEELAVLGSECPSIQEVPKYQKLESLYAQDQEAFQAVRENFAQWKSYSEKNNLRASFVLVQELETSLNKMSFARTGHLFAKIPRFYIDKKFSNRKPLIRTAILHLPFYGAIISSPVWDSVSLKTQMGLLIHESFRQFQGSYKFSDISDRGLQKMTALLMGEPSKNAENLIQEMVKSPTLYRYSSYQRNSLADSFLQDLNNMLSDGQADRMDLILQDASQREKLFQDLIRRKILKP